MNRFARAALLLCFVASSGCGSKMEQVGAAAESARNASEHMVENADAANRNREAQVVADAQSMEDQIQARSGSADGANPRYELRKDAVGDSWTVYDTWGGRAVKIDSKKQSGLSHSDAEATLTAVNQQEKQRAALFAPRSR